MPYSDVIKVSKNAMKWSEKQNFICVKRKKMIGNVTLSANVHFKVKQKYFFNYFLICTLRSENGNKAIAFF